MDGRLLLVVGLFAAVFFAGVGQSFVTGSGGTFSQVIDQSVETNGAGEVTPADAESDDERSGDDGADGGNDADASAGGDDGGGAGAGDDGDSADGTDDADSAGPPFRFEIERIERCGRTCRDVTATLVNGRDDAASNVAVETRIYAGNDTNEGDRVWKGSERVGTLAADADHTSTQRVDLGWGGGLAVKRADGWITVKTTVETADRTVTLERRRDVA